ncbi:hypothetical protein [Hyphomicrobium sp.]|uniref:hypothetical protein n=1 Tax=Hyphomicrobium sp. TaxID=82 RepID=UPI000FAF36A4|nr:hypothetical protein [Hyphomicrobium sp.]RUO97672.1 MAG: hypothetical protein EKK30_12970 [Hyphomicrobium sp.]
MASYPLSIRIFRPASLDVILPDGDDLILSYISKRFRIADGELLTGETAPRPYLSFTPNLGLDQHFINEAAHFAGVDFSDLRSLCMPGGAWLRELYSEPDQLVFDRPD